MASGPAGLLPPYNPQQTEGQELLYSINDRDYSELFVDYECLRSGTDNLKVLVTNERVIVISGGSKAIVTEVRLADLLYCQPTHRIESDGTTLHYIELTSRAESTSGSLGGGGGGTQSDGPEMLRRPKVRCDSEDIAKWVRLCGFGFRVLCLILAGIWNLFIKYYKQVHMKTNNMSTIQS